MYSGYLDRLIQVLKSTQMCSQDGRACSSYDEAMQKLLELFSMIKGQGKQLFFIGNGGSAAIASHMTADFMKNGGMKTYSLYDSSVTTCMGNDYGYEYIFSRPRHSKNPVVSTTSEAPASVPQAWQYRSSKVLHTRSKAG